MGSRNVGMDNVLEAPCISKRCDLSSVVLASSQYAQNFACMQVLKLETYSQFTYRCSHHNWCHLAPQAQPPRYSASSAVNPRRRHPENFQTGICFFNYLLLILGRMFYNNLKQSVIKFFKTRRKVNNL